MALRPAELQTDQFVTASAYLNQIVVELFALAKANPDNRSERLGKLFIVDRPELANQILSRLVESGEVSASLRQFSTAALNLLRNHDWPGNLTQLAGTVRSLALTCASDEISADEVKQALASSTSASTSPTSVLSAAGISLDTPLREARDLFEKTYFERLIDQESGNMTRVAERAGLERTHLYRKLKLLGIKLRSH